MMASVCILPGLSVFLFLFVFHVVFHLVSFSFTSSTGGGGGGKGRGGIRRRRDGGKGITYVGPRCRRCIDDVLVATLAGATSTDTHSDQPQ